MQHLYSVGPVSVAFQVASDFHDYSSGIYTSADCGTEPGDVNHAVLAVGFGYDEDLDMEYWIIKNSWSADWGMDGYFMMEKGKNMCAVAQCNSYPYGVESVGMATAFLQ
mmetsp:Transcript_8008/g.7508  ORF Transcript_8008/g.7508 Transcript_8008/m.7508 type:complete len:109 (+) Transcript_8008:813-1139(+)